MTGGPCPNCGGEGGWWVRLNPWADRAMGRAEPGRWVECGSCVGLGWKSSLWARLTHSAALPVSQRTVV